MWFVSKLARMTRECSHCLDMLKVLNTWMGQNLILKCEIFYNLICISPYLKAVKKSIFSLHQYLCQNQLAFPKNFLRNNRSAFRNECKTCQKLVCLPARDRCEIWCSRRCPLSIKVEVHRMYTLLSYGWRGAPELIVSRIILKYVWTTVVLLFHALDRALWISKVVTQGRSSTSSVPIEENDDFAADFSKNW